MSEAAFEPVRFGRYELEERLAVGGMAEIFRAKTRGAHGFAKTLVVKRILPHLAADSEFIDMFIDEANLMVRLDHPKVVQVLDFGEVDGQYYIAMEYVDGMDGLALLRRCAKRRCRPTTGISVHILADVLDALDYAHSLADEQGRNLGVVHRDVSPSNIFISRLGEVKIGDFGIARAAMRRGHTEAGALKGKYGYMAPEQVAGGVVDHRADLFAVGIVLAEFLMIRRLFYAKNDLEVLLQVRDARLDRLHKYGQRIPDELKQILESSLARDPSLRYQDAAAFRDALHRYLFDTRRMVRATDVRRFLERLMQDEGPITSQRPDSREVEVEAIRHSAMDAPVSLDDERPSMVGPPPQPVAAPPAPPPELARRTPPPLPKVEAVPPPAAGKPRPVASDALASPVLSEVAKGRPPEREVGTPAARRSASSLEQEIEAVLAAHPLPEGALELGELPLALHLEEEPTPVLARPSAAADEGREVVGRRRKIVLSPPAAQPPLPPGTNPTLDEPRLNTEEALAAVPELTASSTYASADYWSYSHLDDDLELPIVVDEAAAAEAEAAAGQRLSPLSAMAATAEADLRGELGRTSLFRVLFKLAVDEETGLLLLQERDRLKEIFLVDGDPQYVTSNRAEELFGQYLLGHGVISKGELSMALAMLPHFDGKLGDTLVALKLLRPMEVLRHLTHQVRHKLLEAFAWTEGTYAFFRGRHCESDSAPLGLDAFEIMGSAVDALSQDFLRARLEPFLDRRPRAAEMPAVPPEVFRLGPAPRQTFDQLDGRVSLRELLTRYDNPEQAQRAARLAYLLLETGLAES
ncbi:MAG: serine/threonine protein kinase [Deltaproteobacteria bacterium]|nr:serine/threonine protein kinase [Deltaproteobacteria bacterium]